MHIPGTRSTTLNKLAWIDVENPDQALLYRLKEEFNFHELDVEDCLSEHQRAKIDEYENYLFIILQIPYYDKKKQRVVTEEIDIFIKNDVLITIHWGGLKVLNDFFESVQTSPKIKKQSMEHGSGFLLYELLDQLYSSVFPMLDVLERSEASLERDVFSMGQQHDMLRDILNLKRNVITMRRVISTQRPVVAQIEHKNKKFLPPTLEIYFDDIVDKVEKIWNTLENLKDLIESVQDTNESIISHHTNNIIKTLTVISVLLMPLTFLTGLYGMNVPLPLEDHPLVFYIHVGGMLTLVCLMLLFFKLKRWI